MIRCFRCGTIARQLPDGTVERTCNCYQPSLIYQVTAQTIGSTGAGAQPCPLCHELVFVQAYHKCRGIGSVPTPASPDDISQAQARRIHAMLTDQIITHRENCAGCKALGRSCFEIRNVEDLQEKWRKKAGIA